MSRRISGEVYAEFAGTTHAPRQARDLVRQVLGDDHPRAPDAQLVTSELVTNAVAHSRSGQPGGTVMLAIGMRGEPAEVRILVRDAGGPDTPATATPADPDSEHGRGLALVTALAAEWGSHATLAGRSTWCRLATTRPEPRPARRAAGREPEREAG